MKRNAYRSLVSIAGEAVNRPSLLTILWGTSSPLIQVIVLPAGTVVVAGMKLKLSILTVVAVLLLDDAVGAAPSARGASAPAAATTAPVWLPSRLHATVRLPVEWTGVAGRVADVFNEVVERNERMAKELARLSHVVGKEGKLGKRGSLGDVSGFWRESIDNVNQLIDDLVHPTSETARVIGAVAQGDLSQTMALEVDGEPLQGEFLRIEYDAPTVATVDGVPIRIRTCSWLAPMGICSSAPSGIT